MIITALAEMVENDSVKIGGRTVMYQEIIENSYLSECFIGFEKALADADCGKENYISQSVHEILLIELAMLF